MHKHLRCIIIVHIPFSYRHQRIMSAEIENPSYDDCFVLCLCAFLRLLARRGIFFKHNNDSPLYRSGLIVPDNMNAEVRSKFITGGFCPAFYLSTPLQSQDVWIERYVRYQGSGMRNHCYVDWGLRNSSCLNRWPDQRFVLIRKFCRSSM